MSYRLWAHSANVGLAPGVADPLEEEWVGLAPDVADPLEGERLARKFKEKDAAILHSSNGFVI